MPKFSDHSKEILNTCHIDIQQVFYEVIKTIDCRAISGFRGEAEQDKLYYTGKSQVKYPNSYHNKMPQSHAIDIMPYPIDWNDRERCTLFAGYVLGVADSMGVKLTWGGDWNRNFKVGDNKFDDFAHFQIEE